MKELKMTQEAYIVSDEGTVHYEAAAVDEQDETYTIRWETVDDYDELDDEGDACDWSEYTVIKDGVKVGDETSYAVSTPGGYRL